MQDDALSCKNLYQLYCGPYNEAQPQYDLSFAAELELTHTKIENKKKDKGGGMGYLDKCLKCSRKAMPKVSTSQGRESIQGKAYRQCVGGAC